MRVTGNDEIANITYAANTRFSDYLFYMLGDKIDGVIQKV
mgnify:CR=1 FL=1|jgi:hypothetical protein